VSTLGSGSYEIHLYDRGGANPIGVFRDVESLSFTRQRDDVSEALLILRGEATRNDLARRIRSVRHELVIFRNGERVWEGPITRVEYTPGRLEIAARDVLWWMSRTAVTTHKSYAGKNKGVNILTVAESLLAMVYNKDHDWLNVWKFVKRYDAPSTRLFEGEWVAYQETVYHVMERMAQDWDLDYAAVGRRIYIFDVHTRMHHTQALSDGDFMNALVMTEYGADLRTVLYSTRSGRVYYRQADSALRSYYGPVEDVRANSNEDADAPRLPPIADPKKPALDEGPAPVRVRVPDDTQLSPNAPVRFSELVPGAWIPIRTDLMGRPYDGWMKLDRVQVTWEPVAGERVSITVVQSPSDMEDPTP
jgi:hypothetical protein